jgi:hypothetical protein
MLRAAGFGGSPTSAEIDAKSREMRRKSGWLLAMLRCGL